jgi:hypothetical protein
MFLAVAAQGASELPAETAGEIKLVIKPAGVGDFCNGVAGFEKLCDLACNDFGMTLKRSSRLLGFFTEFHG